MRYENNPMVKYPLGGETLKNQPFTGGRGGGSYAKI